MKYLLAAVLLLSGCHQTPKEACDFRNGQRAFMGLPTEECKSVCDDCSGNYKYKGGMTWSVIIPIEQIKCAKGNVEYVRVNITTSFPTYTQSSEFGWQCIDGKHNTLHHLKAESISLEGNQDNE